MMKLSLRKTYCVIVITLIYIILVALSGMFNITHTCCGVSPQPFTAAADASSVY